MKRSTHLTFGTAMRTSAATIALLSLILVGAMPLHGQNSEASSSELVSPPNGARDLPERVTLTWTSDLLANGYELEVSTSSSFSTLTISERSLSTTSYETAPLQRGTTFFWRVRPRFLSIPGSWSDVWSFTTLPDPPAPPVLVAPVDGAAGVVEPVTLEWQGVAGANFYNVQVGRNAEFESIFLDSGAVMGTFVVLASLEPESTYFWRVRGNNAAGDGPWSGARRFSMAPPSPPESPAAIAPSDGATDLTDPVTLEWQNAARAESYRLQLALDSEFTTPSLDVGNIAVTSYAVSGLEAGGTYFWRVRARNAGGEGAWSASSRFTTAPPDPPDSPVVIAPAENAADLTDPVTLEWQRDTAAEAYRVQVGNDGEFQSAFLDSGSYAGTTMSISGLSEGSTYFWRVRGQNRGGEGTWSVTRRFTMALPIPDLPQTPTLASPPHETTVQGASVTVSWFPSVGSESYRLQVSTNRPFTKIHSDRSDIVDTTSIVDSLTEGQSYWWRVRGVNAAGEGSWSEPWNILTQAAMPDAPILVSPQNGSAGLAIPVDLEWSIVTAAGSYRVQVAADSNFMAPVLDSSGILTSELSVSSLDYEGTYFWRVRSAQASGSSAWSQVWNFRTAAEPPSPPTPPAPTSPPTGSTNVELPVHLVWTLIASAESYRVQVSLTSDFRSPAFDSSGIRSSEAFVASLVRDGLYCWRVRSENAGGSSAWSSVWNFRTAPPPPPPPPPPTAPAPIEPPENATTRPDATTFAWSSSTGADVYRFQASTDAGFSTLAVDDGNVVDTIYSLSSLDPGTAYNWRVRAINETGPGPWSEPRQFTTASASSAGPQLQSPPNGAKNQPLTLTLTWTEESGSTSYQLQADESPTFASPKVDNSGMTSTSSTIGPLEYGTKYYWRVRGAFLGLPGDWSATWSFETLPSPPPAPGLVSPADRATQQPLEPTLVWTGTSGAASYTVQVSGNSSFAALRFEDTTITASSLTLPTLHADSTYHWRVKEKNAGGWGPWSAKRQFTTIERPRPVASTGSASNIGVNNATVSGLVDPNGERTYVFFDYALDSLFNAFGSKPSADVTGTTVVAVSATLDSLLPGIRYYFRIRAQSARDTVLGATRFFATSVPPYEEELTAAAEVSFPNLGSASEYAQSTYRIVGLPGASNASISTFLSGTRNVDWEVYWDDGSPSGTMRPFDGGKDFTCTVGRGFWLIHRGPWSVSAVLPSAPLNAQQEAEIPLHAGWNLITNPFPYRVDWAEVQRVNGILDSLYAFEGTFNTSGIVEPCKGYYFFNESNRPILRVPYSAAFTRSTQGTSASKLAWGIRIVVRTGAIADSSAWIGVNRADEAQPHRIRKPLAGPGSPSVLFKRPDWDPDYPVYANDFRSNNTALHEWRFEVRAPLLEDVELSFRGLDAIPAGSRAVLIDETRNTTVDLRAGPVHAFRAVRNPMSFMLIVGPSDSVQEALGARTAPEAFLLEPNYPNPFNPVTLIPIHLPESDQVVLTIHDVLGRRVTVLRSGMLEAGRHWFEWDGRDDRGARVASGSYYARCTTTRWGTKVQRMMLTH